MFEGRDTAGKGGTIKAITERVSPRVFRVVALPAPTERERSQMYLQRYVPHLPGAGDVVIFDRSWYNRAGVERVMGFCTEGQVDQFLQAAPGVERAIVDSGVILLKFRATDTSWAPWYVANTDDKKRGRLNVLSHVLSIVPYRPLPHRDVTLPKRQEPDGYRDPTLSVRHIPTPF